MLDPWCMPWSLTSGFLWSQWRGIRSRHSQPIRNSQLYVSGKRPMYWCPFFQMSRDSEEAVKKEVCFCVGLNSCHAEIIFQNHQNTAYVLNITFIFDRCCRSWAVETPAKYKCNSKDLLSSIDCAKLQNTEKLMTGAHPSPVELLSSEIT